MSKIYQVAGASGKAKNSWEEILCDKIWINDNGIAFFCNSDDSILIAYKLADGEAVSYVGEE